MIDVICKSDAYTYNVYHIMKAFFPSEEIKVRTEEEASHYLMVRLPDGARQEKSRRIPAGLPSVKNRPQKPPAIMGMKMRNVS